MARNNQSKSVILRLLISIAVMVPICTLVESSPAPAPTPVTMDATTASDPADPTATFVLAETKTEAPRVSISLSDDASQSFKLEKALPSSPKPAGRPDIDVWYGGYFSDRNYILPASPIEKEPGRLCLKVSFSF
jgi:hypothetical protein